MLILLLILSATIPALVWLFFFLREDIHPEPRKLLVKTFLTGALITAPTLVVQLAAQQLIPPSFTVAGLLILAAVEEIGKFFAAYASANKNPALDEPIDAMIYTITAASGFATVENILIVLGTLASGENAGAADAGGILLLRFVGATLLHVLSGGIIGYYWAKARKQAKKDGYILTGITLATAVHFIFNYLVDALHENNLIYSSMILIAASFFVLNDFEKLKKTTPT